MKPNLYIFLIVLLAANIATSVINTIQISAIKSTIQENQEKETSNTNYYTVEDMKNLEKDIVYKLGYDVNTVDEAVTELKISKVVANMHTLQTILETYAVDWGGRYPKNIEEAYKWANKAGYWYNFKNPFTDAISNGAYLDVKEHIPSIQYAGMIFYEIDQETDQYKVYGADEKGILFKRYLTNN